MFASIAGIELTHVPYKGGVNAMTDIIAGQVSMMFSNLVGVLPSIRGGKLRALGVADSRRHPSLPDVPTFVEMGYKDFEVTVWWGVMTTAGTPAPVVAQLNREIVASLSAPELKDRLDGMGARILGGTPEQFGGFLNEEIARWGRAVKASGATQE